MTNIKIEENNFKYLRLGSSFSDHFVLEIDTTKKIGRVLLVDKYDLVKFEYKFTEDGIKVIKQYLEMIK